MEAGLTLVRRMAAIMKRIPEMSCEDGAPEFDDQRRALDGRGFGFGIDGRLAIVFPGGDRIFSSRKPPGRGYVGVEAASALFGGETGGPAAVESGSARFDLEVRSMKRAFCQIPSVGRSFRSRFSIMGSSASRAANASFRV